MSPKFNARVMLRVRVMVRLVYHSKNLTRKITVDRGPTGRISLARDLDLDLDLDLL